MTGLLRVLALLAAQEADSLDRLVVELKSPSVERRELAALALRAHGALAVERLEKAKADRAIIDACSGISPESRKLLNSLEEKRVALPSCTIALGRALDLIRERSALAIQVEEQIRTLLDWNREVVLKEGAVTAGEALRQLFPKEGGYFFNASPEGALVIAPFAPGLPPARLPVRILIPQDPLRRQVRLLGSESMEERDQAFQALKGLGFSAEPALWEALDSAELAVRGRATLLIRELYAPTPIPSDHEAVKKLGQPASIDVKEVPLLSVLRQVVEPTGLTLVVDSRALAEHDKELVSARIQDLNANGILRLILGPRRLSFGIWDRSIFVSRPECIASWSHSKSLWRDPEEARELEARIRALASPDPKGHDAARKEFLKMGAEAYEPLLHASRVHEGNARKRFEEVRREIARASGAWLSEDSAAVYRQEWTGAQRSILKQNVNALVFAQPFHKFLKEVKVDIRLNAQADRAVYVWARDTVLIDLLVLLTRPYDLDFFMDGETVVIDTAAKVQEGLKK